MAPVAWSVTKISPTGLAVEQRVVHAHRVLGSVGQRQELDGLAGRAGVVDVHRSLSAWAGEHQVAVRCHGHRVGVCRFSVDLFPVVTSVARALPASTGVIVAIEPFRVIFTTAGSVLGLFAGLEAVRKTLPPTKAMSSKPPPPLTEFRVYATVVGVAGVSR